MTRAELIERVTAWNPQQTMKERDLLEFALWWLCRSTEARKPNPSWPGEDYIPLGGTRYLSSVDDALSLMPPDLYWLVGKGKDTEAEPLYGAQVFRFEGGEPIAEAEHDRTLAIAICLAAIRAREWSSRQ